MVMLRKGIRYEVRPVMATGMPQWLVDKHHGQLPAVVHQGVTVVGPLKIAEYFERNYPQNTLTRQGTYSYQEVLERVSGFFPALTAVITNKDRTLDTGLLEQLNAQLDLLDELIRSAPGKYLCGIDVTLADLYLTPRLFHAVAALQHFKGINIHRVGTDPLRPALEHYMSRVFRMGEFTDRRAYYNVDQVVYGWKVRRGDLSPSGDKLQPNTSSSRHIK